METFSALLAICAGNSPVTGEFPAQRPVTRSFDVLFDLRLNKRLSKQPWGWWFETLSGPLWRHCNVVWGDIGTSNAEIWWISLLLAEQGTPKRLCDVEAPWRLCDVTAMPWYFLITTLIIDAYNIYCEIYVYNFAWLCCTLVIYIWISLESSDLFTHVHRGLVTYCLNAPTTTGGFPSQRASNAKHWCLLYYPETVEHTFEMPVMWDIITLLWRHCHGSPEYSKVQTPIWWIRFAITVCIHSTGIRAKQVSAFWTALQKIDVQI